jgi:hypothetical protein
MKTQYFNILLICRSYRVMLTREGRIVSISTTTPSSLVTVASWRIARKRGSVISAWYVNIGRK